MSPPPLPHQPLLGYTVVKAAMNLNLPKFNPNRLYENFQNKLHIANIQVSNFSLHNMRQYRGGSCNHSKMWLQR